MHGSLHIKVEYPEAVENKKNMLHLEKSMLEIVRHMRAYNNLRKKEFSIKSDIKNKFANILTLVSTIETYIPQEDMKFTNEGYKKEIKNNEIRKKLHKKITEQKKSEIEDKIDDIRSRLAQLG